MKLIIDISEKLVEKEHFYTEEELWTVIRAVENGTPLDDVKAEIEKQIESDFAFAKTESLAVPCHYGIANGLQVAMRILDYMSKAESEESE